MFRATHHAAPLALTGLAVSAASVAGADQVFYEWTGAVSTAWSNGANWDPVGVPNVAGDVALFPGGHTCDLDISVIVDKLGNGLGDTLNMLNDRDLSIIGTTETGGDAETGIFSIYGTLNMLSTVHATDLSVRGDTLTIGNIDDLPAVINMSNSSANRIIGVFGTETMNFGQSLLVRGSGQIGANTIRINNYGTIRADQSTELVLDPNASGFFNLGEIGAESGATLRLDPGTYDNSGGLIVARDASVVLLNGPALVGAGVIQTFGSGVIRVNTVGTGTSLDAQTVSGTLELPNDRDVLLTGITSIGALNLLGTVHDTRVHIDGPVSFSGTINMSNTTTNVVSALSGGLSGDSLTFSSATVRGSGHLGANTMDITNHSNIIADQPTVLVIDPAGALLNAPTGLIAAQGGGTLRLDSGAYDNQGVIAADDGSVVQFNGCTVNGLLGGAGSGYFDVVTTGTATLLHDVTIQQRLNLLNDRDVWLQGTIINNASIDVGGTIHDTRLYLDGPVTLTGGGSVNMSNSTTNALSGLGGALPDDFFFNHDNLIRGAGQLGVNSIDVLNQGVVRADFSGSTLIIDPVVTFTNEGSIEAVNGSIVQLAPGDFQNTGSVSASDASRVDLNGCSLNGLLSTDASSFFNVLTTGGSTLLHNFTLNGRLVQSNDRDLVVRGTITHTGNWDVQASIHDTRVFVDGPVTLTGGGSMNLSNSGDNVIASLGGGLEGDLLTIADYTIRGAGQIGINTLDTDNQGVIIADQPSLLILDPVANFTNTGTLHAAGTGGMRLDAGTYTNSGLVIVDPGSKIDLTSGSFTQTAGQTVVNGEFESDPNLLTFSGGTVSGSGLVDSNVTSTGATFAPGNSIGTLSVEGNYTQDAGAALEVELATGQSDRLAVTGVATMDGVLRAVAGPGYVPLVGDEFIVLTAASVAGVGPTLDLLDFPLGRDVDMIIEPTQIRLVVTIGCVADWNADSQVNFFDVQGYLNDFSAHRPVADLNDDGLFNFFDVQAFLNAFSDGCG